MADRFAKMPHKVYFSADYKSLSFAEKAVLMALMTQYNGKNNGDLSLAPSIMKAHGLFVPKTLERAKKTLIQRDLIIRTRQGGFGSTHTCDLFALTWEKIDPCKGKLEVRPTISPIRAIWDREFLTNPPEGITTLIEWLNHRNTEKKRRARVRNQKKITMNIVSIGGRH